MPAEPVDPNRVRDQPSLRTSEGRIWLVVGGLLALVALAILIPMLWLEAAGVAATGIGIVALAYAAMLIVRFTISNRRRRMAVLAILMIVMALGALVSVGIAAAAQGGL